MNLYGLLIAKDEADIIEQTLLSLREFGGFKKIFFYDNGSSDETANIAKKFNDIIPKVYTLTDAFSDHLKYQLLNSHADEYKLGDWLAIIDADELYAENALDKISIAENSQANYIESKSAQFYFTDREDCHTFLPNIPAIAQRPHYLINYGEPRLFKFIPDQTLSEHTVKSRSTLLKLSPDKLLLNHFQYRSALQTQHRIDVRIANNNTSNNWGHIKDKHWQDYLVKADYLHRYDKQPIFGLPQNANLYKTPNNPAYTSASLKWMATNGYLTEQQQEFFKAGRVERLLRKIL